MKKDELSKIKDLTGLLEYVHEHHEKHYESLIRKYNEFHFLNNEKYKRDLNSEEIELRNVTDMVAYFRENENNFDKIFERSI